MRIDRQLRHGHAGVHIGGARGGIGDVALEHDLEAGHVQRRLLTVERQVAAHGQALGFCARQLAVHAQVELLRGIALGGRIQRQQGLTGQVGVDARIAAFDARGQAHVERLVERDAPGIGVDLGDRHRHAADGVLQLHLAVFQVQAGDIDLHVVARLRQAAIGNSLRGGLGRAHQRLRRIGRHGRDRRGAAHKIAEIELALLVADHARLEAADGHVVDHEAVGQQGPHGDRQAGAFDGSEGLGAIRLGQRHSLHRQADAREKRQLDLAVDRQRAVIALLDKLFQLVLVRIGVECQQEDGQANDGHDNQHHQAYQNALEPRFHCCPVGTSTGNPRMPPTAPERGDGALPVEKTARHAMPPAF
ncbi:hypothetical protein FQZ97_738610 [compost metagenome]